MCPLNPGQTEPACAGQGSVRSAAVLVCPGRARDKRAGAVRQRWLNPRPPACWPAVLHMTVRPEKSVRQGVLSLPQRLAGFLPGLERRPGGTAAHVGVSAEREDCSAEP